MTYTSLTNNNVLKRLVYIISIATVVFAILLWVGVFTPWKKISSSRFRYVEYDKNSRTVWLAENYGDAIYKMQHFDNGFKFGNAEKITTPNGSHISSMCVSDGVWISSFIYNPTPVIPESSSDTIYTVYKYTNNTKLWQSLAVSTKNIICKPLNDGSIVFLGQNEIIRFGTTQMQPQYISVSPDRWIRDIASDLNGNLWASTTEGEIYKYDDESWILVDDFGTDSSPQLFFDKNGNLWVNARDKYIYKYSADYAMPHREKEFELPLDTTKPELLSEMVINFFQDENGLIWLATNRRFLVKREEQFQDQDFALPPRTTYINFGFYDSETNSLFVSTAKGVFALDLDTLQ